MVSQTTATGEVWASMGPPEADDAPGPVQHSLDQGKREGMHKAPALANCEPENPSTEAQVAPTWSTTGGCAHCPGRQTGPPAPSRTCATGAAPPGDVGSSPKVVGPPL